MTERRPRDLAFSIAFFVFAKKKKKKELVDSFRYYCSCYEFMHIAVYIFTDVTRESTRSLIQRPCHESDAVADCRLTDPIIPTVRPIEFNERIQLWNEAHCECTVLTRVNKRHGPI